MNNNVLRTELEEHLLADPGGGLCSQIIAEMRSAADQFRRRIARGLPPEQFDREDACRRAFEAGISVLETFSERLSKIQK